MHNERTVWHMSGKGTAEVHQNIMVHHHGANCGMTPLPLPESVCCKTLINPSTQGSQISPSTAVNAACSCFVTPGRCCKDCTYNVCPRSSAAYLLACAFLSAFFSISSNSRLSFSAISCLYLQSAMKKGGADSSGMNISELQQRC